MKIELYDFVRLKDGREGDVMDISPDSLQIDIQIGPEEFETDYDVKPSDVTEIIKKHA